MTTTKPVVDSLTTQGKGMPENDVPPQTIIRDCETPCGGFTEVRNYGSTPIIPPAVSGGAERIIPAEPNCSAHYDDEFIIRPTSEAQASVGKNYSDMVAAEQRRQTVQAESMVNLAVGVTLMKSGILDGLFGEAHVEISPKDLIDFQQNYTVTQEIQPDGGFIISVSPKHDPQP